MDKIRYDGDFVRGLYHGRGKLIYFVGDKYEGDFFKGKRQGKGVLMFKMKTGEDSGQPFYEWYEGEWFNDKYEGWGVYSNSAKGVIYRGNWRFGRRHGQGHYRVEGQPDLVEGVFCDGDMFQM